MQSKVVVTGMSAMAANFHRLDQVAKEKVLEAQRINAEEHKERMAAEAPRDTGFLAEHTEIRLSEGGYRYECGYWEESFTADGKEFYAHYVALGTSKMAGNDWIFRATEPMRDIARRRVGDALNGAANEVAV
jgi:hypothetical protein